MKFLLVKTVLKNKKPGILSQQKILCWDLLMKKDKQLQKSKERKFFYHNKSGEFELVNGFATTLGRTRVFKIKIKSVKSMSAEEGNTAVNERGPTLFGFQHNSRLK